LINVSLKEKNIFSRNGNTRILRDKNEIKEIYNKVLGFDMHYTIPVNLNVLFKYERSNTMQLMRENDCNIYTNCCHQQLNHNINTFFKDKQNKTILIFGHEEEEIDRLTDQYIRELFEILDKQKHIVTIRQSKYNEFYLFIKL
jgi:homoserine trans-succinylase